ncbi:unnamed protein product, partial [Heterotrigona itama]
LPEDYLIKKAVAIRKHLERNQKDKGSKFRLILMEPRIHLHVFINQKGPRGSHN